MFQKRQNTKKNAFSLKKCKLKKGLGEAKEWQKRRTRQAISSTQRQQRLKTFWGLDLSKISKKIVLRPLRTPNFATFNRDLYKVYQFNVLPHALFLVIFYIVVYLFLSMSKNDPKKLQNGACLGL